MFPSFNIYSSTLLILTLQGLVFSFLLFRKYIISQNISSLLLALILLITCYHQTSYTIGFMDWYDTYRTTKINYYLVNLSLALAPLIFFYVRSITNPKKDFVKKDSVHFIPVLLFIVIKLIILVYDSNQIGFDDTQNGYLVVNFQWKFLDPFVALFSMLQMLIYLVLSFQLLYTYREKITHFFSNTYKLELNWLNSFLIIYTILYVYYSIQIVIDATIVNLSWIQEWWYYLLSGFAIIYVGIKGYFTNLSQLKHIEIASFLEQKNNVLQKELNQSELKTELPEKLKGLKESVNAYFDTHKPYLEPDLTLISLSKKLSVSREDLSEVINKGFNVKFNDFINQYRIEEFKLKLSEGQYKQLSFLGIAYECGFNSKATFNRAFKKFTNSSPSQYLETVK